MSDTRWSVHAADLGSGQGAEQAGERPVLVVSNDAFNRVMPVVTVLPFTSVKPGRRIYPGEVLVRKAQAGLSADSIVMAHQVRTIARTRLRRSYGRIVTPEVQKQIEGALKLHLGLE